jgi:putative tryptophan/tyrosine transport system substrate-binding protein
MRRREFIAMFGGAATTWPVAARAQQRAMPVIGFLSSGSAKTSQSFVTAFRQGLSESGYVEGQNLAIEYRWADGDDKRLPRLAADLVDRRVNAIFPVGVPAVMAAKAATTTIPIVFETAGDPVQLGLVTSLARPGGNLTGVTSLNTDLGSKLLELLHELAPRATIIGLLVNPDNPSLAEPTTKSLQGAARTLGLEAHVLHASADHDFDKAFATLVQLRAGALVIGPDPFFFTRSEQLGALAFRYAIPSICPYREFALAGGLMSYGTNIANLFRQVGVYTSRILKGEKAADLPVQQAVKLELVINHEAANALGLAVSNQMQLLADEVIE